MRILSLLFIIIFSTSVFAETYICDYEELNKVKKFSLDRVTHSHFKKCLDNICEKIGLSIIHVDNNNLLFGDIFLNERSIKYFRIYFIDKEKNLFKDLKIYLPDSNLENEVIEGNCHSKN